MIGYLGWHNWGILPAQDYPLLPNPLLTNLAWSRRLSISLLLFVCFVFYLILVWKVENKTKKNQKQQLGPHTVCKLLSNVEVSRKQTTKSVCFSLDSSLTNGYHFESFEQLGLHV